MQNDRCKIAPLNFLLAVAHGELNPAPVCMLILRVSNMPCNGFPFNNTRFFSFDNSTLIYFIA